MRLLLDTHTFLWFIIDDSSLSGNARALIEDSNNNVVLSVASLWEMAIKISLGNLTISQPFNVFMTEQMRLNAIDLLNISIDHAAVVATLPFHHRDPFDRLLVAQAMVERLPIVSVDTVFDAYDVERLW
jgi:PIN domain nuclease of toxin-antitoxin system